MERIVELATKRPPAVVVVDSIQTATVDELDGPAGSVGQVRESTLRLMELAKGEGVAVVLVGHVTKDGSIAGPKTLEHLVDAVLNLEGERYAALRVLRATKNRFGSTDEVGVFEMVEAGLREVDDPSRAFLVEHERPAPGSVVAPTLGGQPPAAGRGPRPRRAIRLRDAGPPGSGIDPNRLALLVAVLGRRAAIGLGSHDVYVNLAGASPSTSRDSTCRWRSRCVVAARRPGRSTDRRDRRSRAPRRVARGGRARAPAARGGPARFERAIVPRGGRSTQSAPLEGLDIVAVATARGGHRRRAREHVSGAWRGALRRC